MGVITWFLVFTLICVDPLHGQYTITPVPQTSITLGIRADPVIFESLNKNDLVDPPTKSLTMLAFHLTSIPFIHLRPIWYTLQMT